jgi:hypothetical protein
VSTDPHWTAYAAALLTPVVAALGIYIAWRQAQIARNKLKLDLFVKRLELWESAYELFRRGGDEGADEVWVKFHSARYAAAWLTGPEVERAMDAFLEAIRAARTQQQAPKEAGKPRTNEWPRAKEALERLRATLTPYMTLEH